MELVDYAGWKRNARITNGRVELVVTGEVGPRILRCGFVGERNLFAEFAEQRGGHGEAEWRIRGGHRLWIAPEDPARTYEPDNEPPTLRGIRHGVRVTAPIGPRSGIERSLAITIAPSAPEVRVVHTLVNRSRKAVTVSPWALSVMEAGGLAIIPLPARLRHSERLTPNQNWSLWGYTDLGDPRLHFGSRYVFVRQRRDLGPLKLGMAHRQGWVAYQLGGHVFVKWLPHVEGAAYPDGGVNFELFTDERILELESLGPLTRLRGGESVRHAERWTLLRGVPHCHTEEDIDKHLRPLVEAAR